MVIKSRQCKVLQIVWLFRKIKQNSYFLSIGIMTTSMICETGTAAS